jgi:hypothetical protein
MKPWTDPDSDPVGDVRRWVEIARCWHAHVAHTENPLRTWCMDCGRDLSGREALILFESAMRQMLAGMPAAGDESPGVLVSDLLSEDGPNG